MLQNDLQNHRRPWGSANLPERKTGWPMDAHRKRRRSSSSKKASGDVAGASFLAVALQLLFLDWIHGEIAPCGCLFIHVVDANGSARSKCSKSTIIYIYMMIIIIITAIINNMFPCVYIYIYLFI